MPENDEDPSSSDLTPAPAPAPLPTPSGVGGPTEYGGPPPPEDDQAFVLEAGPDRVKVSGTLAAASLLIPAAVLIIGAVMWANGAMAPGITLMVLILIVTAFWHRSLHHRNSHRD